MPLTRRHSLALCGGALLAACGRAPAPTPAPGTLDPAALDLGFQALADAARPARFALGVLDLDRDRPWVSDRAGRYCLAGLAHLAIAAAALGAVDAGRLRLGERIMIGPDDLGPPPSRINQLFAAEAGRRDLWAPLADLIALAVQREDSTASDILMTRMGGPAAVTAWLRTKGVMQMRIDRPDRERVCETFGLGPFQPSWRDPPGFQTALDAVTPETRQAAMDASLDDARDTTTVGAVLDFLSALTRGALLSPRSSNFLLRSMASYPPRPPGLAEGLPPGAQSVGQGVATATVLGITVAANEIAVARLADGRRLALAGLLVGSTTTAAARHALLVQAGALAAAGGRPS